MTLIKDCLEAAAGLIGADLDEEDLHLAERSVPHFVNHLRQAQARAADKGEREGVAKRFRMFAQGSHFGELQEKRAIGQDDGEVLVETGSELLGADFGEVEHLGEFHTKVSPVHNGKMSPEI